MTERLLQFIWQFQYFNTSGLVTEHGDELAIIHPGQFNTNQGPDFLNARVITGNNTTWIGNIELHIRSSDWNYHQHSADNNYGNIILHVVWEHDTEITDIHQSMLPVLALQNRVRKVLLHRFEALMQSQGFVPSQQYLPALNEIGWLSWKERLAAERLERKSQLVLSYLGQANNHWEEVFWWMLARNFGIKINSDIFETIARSIPVNILSRHKNQIHQLESLLLGQAGLLNGTFTEDYPILLQREYMFLTQKYRLVPVPVKPFFLRMRPASFPTIRMAQLAMVIHVSSHLFSKIKEAGELKTVKNIFDITPNDYWHYHYLFDDAGSFKPKPLGKQMTDNIMINTVIPILFAYGLFNNDEIFKQRAIHWLTQLAPEKNEITRQWQSLGICNDNALESQALIELKNSYCDQKRCLDCAVGNIILKTNSL